MRLCNSEVIKKIKELEDKKSVLLNQERSRCTYTYVDESAKIVPAYSYEKTREQVDKLDAKIRSLRHVLAKANCSVTVDEFNVTIGEALVMLAQMQSKCSVLSDLSERQQLTQQVSYNGKMQITACNYDVEKVINECEKLRNAIAKLQVAIDRANLTNYVEVDL